MSVEYLKRLVNHLGWHPGSLMIYSVVLNFLISILAKKREHKNNLQTEKTYAPFFKNIWNTKILKIFQCLHKIAFANKDWLRIMLGSEMKQMKLTQCVRECIPRNERKSIQKWHSVCRSGFILFHILTHKESTYWYSYSNYHFKLSVYVFDIETNGILLCRYNAAKDGH